MRLFTGFLERLTQEENQALVLPNTLASILVDLAILLSSFFPAVDPDSVPLRFILGITGLFYILFLYFVGLPLIRQHARLNWLIVTLNGIAVALLPIIAPNLGSTVFSVILVSAVMVSAILAGRWPTYLFIGVTTFLSYFLSFRHAGTNFSQWIDFLSEPILSVMITEAVVNLGHIISAQMRRLETINHIAREVSSTIEAPQVISLVCNALQNAIVADTYYVGMVQGEDIRLELLSDEGKFYPKQTLPYENSPVGWVIRKKQSLLLNDYQNEIAHLGLDTKIVGSNRRSSSWMGVPLEVGGVVLGAMAVASYRRNAFNLRDLELLESMAQQAALAIDNANHHAQVEEQSHTDSLTRVYTHGYFLVCVNQYLEYAQETKIPFGLIMLDLDFFKQYNDNYGHLVGDQVLIQVVETIRQNIRSTDIIGRWGGEEFVILLPEANGPQASLIAERIRRSISSISICDASGHQVPPPSASQGIAICPSEAEDVQALIHLADRRLYLAKERGRDQVEPDAQDWARQS